MHELQTEIPQTPAGTSESRRRATVRPLSWEQWPQVEATWAHLAASTGGSSFFTGAEWTGCWLEVFGPVLRPQILLIDEDGHAVGACLLVARTQRWARVIPVRCVYLNTSGEDHDESACIEYNDLLSAPGRASSVAAALVEFLRGQGWDWMAINAFTGTPAMAALLQALPDSWRQSTQSKPSHFADLAAIRRTGQDYLSALSPNTRSQIRRSQKLYSERGELCVRAAETVEEALAMLEELMALHERSWRARGKPGAFAADRFALFHRKLVARSAPAGGVQLLRISAGREPIGVLYNFVRDGTVYFYQSGLAEAPDNRHKPGLTCHTAAIEHCLKRGFHEYDFLAGEGQYKRSLATHSRALHWLRVERPGRRLKAASLLRGVAAGARAWFGARRRDGSTNAAG